MAATEDKKNGGHGAVCMGCNCGCGMGGGSGRHWTFFLLRTLVTILILMVVFWFGLAVGRMSSGYAARNEFMMRGGNGMYGGMGGVNPGGPMIPINGATSTPTGSARNY